MFIPDLKIECDLLRYIRCDENGEIEITSEELHKATEMAIGVCVDHIFFAPDTDCAPVGIVVEHEPLDDRDPWICYPVVLTKEEVDYFQIDPWQEYDEN